LAERGLAFAAAALAFAGPHLEVEDLQRDDAERRLICLGMRADRMVVVGSSLRGADGRVFRMRRANDRALARIARSLGSDPQHVAKPVIQPADDDELPELTDAMPARGTVNRGGRPRSIVEPSSIELDPTA
jgi:uncharacterized protein